MSKKFVGETFRVSLVSGTEKVHALEGYVTTFDFRSKPFCLTVPKISVEENPLVFYYFRVSKKHMLQRVMSLLSISCQKFCLTVPKISVGGILQCFISFGYQKNICFRGLCHNFRFPVDFLLSHSAEMFRR